MVFESYGTPIGVQSYENDQEESVFLSNRENKLEYLERMHFV